MMKVSLRQALVLYAGLGVAAILWAKNLPRIIHGWPFIQALAGDVWHWVATWT
jgi:hypothetical protein